jgi:predicted NAD/FAD-dependent oxidoreductase
MNNTEPAHSVAIIGAGITGLSAARALGAQGVQAVLYDKGRGIGGRVATRRVTLEGGGLVQFDHGAQFATAKGAGFASALQSIADAAVPWQTDDAAQSDRAQIIGKPAMSSLARALGQGAYVVQNAQVTGLHRPSGGPWQISFADGGRALAHRLVLTVPAPQLAALLGADHALVRAAGHVVMQPCLTLMMAALNSAAAPFTALRRPDHDLAWIAQDSSKDARPRTFTSWVAQAGLSFSMQHLEKPPAEIATLMQPMLCDALGISGADVVYTAAHRWRYARVQTPLGTAFLQDAQSGLYVGGDWCLGARIEAAWDSGVAIAADIIASGP